MKKLLLLIVLMTSGILNAQTFRLNEATNIFVAPDSASNTLKITLKKDSVIIVSDYTLSGWALYEKNAETKGFVPLSILTPLDEKAQRIVDQDPLLRSSYKMYFTARCIRMCLIALAIGLFALWAFKKWRFIQLPITVLALLTISCTQLLYYWLFGHIDVFEAIQDGMLAFIGGLIGHSLFLFAQTVLFFITLGQISNTMTFGKSGAISIVAFIILFIMVLIVLFVLDMFAITHEASGFLLKWSWMIFLVFIPIQIIMLFVRKVKKEGESIGLFIFFTIVYIIGMAAILMYGSDVVIALVIALSGAALLAKSTNTMVGRSGGAPVETMGQWVKNSDGNKVFKQVEKGKHYQQ